MADLTLAAGALALGVLLLTALVLLISILLPSLPVTPIALGLTWAAGHLLISTSLGRHHHKTIPSLWVDSSRPTGPAPTPGCPATANSPADGTTAGAPPAPAVTKLLPAALRQGPGGVQATDHRGPVARAVAAALVTAATARN